MTDLDEANKLLRKKQAEKRWDDLLASAPEIGLWPGSKAPQEEQDEWDRAYRAHTDFWRDVVNRVATVEEGDKLIKALEKTHATKRDGILARNDLFEFIESFGGRLVATHDEGATEKYQSDIKIYQLGPIDTDPLDAIYVTWSQTSAGSYFGERTLDDDSYKVTKGAEQEIILRVGYYELNNVIMG